MYDELFKESVLKIREMYGNKEINCGNWCLLDFYDNYFFLDVNYLEYEIFER